MLSFIHDLGNLEFFNCWQERGIQLERDDHCFWPTVRAEYQWFSCRTLSTKTTQRLRNLGAGFPTGQYMSEGHTSSIANATTNVYTFVHS